MNNKTILIGIIDDDRESTNRVISILETNAEDIGFDIDINFFEATRTETQKNKNNGTAGTIEELLDCLEKFFSRKDNPKILLIDFKLSASIAPFGSSLALRLKEEQETQSFLKDLPIVGTSNVVKSPQLTEHKKAEFIDIFDKQDLDRLSKSIFQIAIDYPKLYELTELNDENRKEKIFELITIPNNSKDVFWNAIPTDFKKDWDLDTPQSLARWIWKYFSSKPGLLLNRLYTATLIGVEENAFQKVENKFEGALYKGIFSVDNRQRWWKERLIEILESSVKETKIMPIWKRGHHLDEINNEDKVKCRYTEETEKKMIPAFIDEGRDELVPISYDLTKEDPKENIEVGFDAVRIHKDI